MKRALALLLALLMLLASMALIFTSCGEEEETSKKKENNATAVEGEEGDIFWERAQVKDDIGDHDFNEKELRNIENLFQIVQIFYRNFCICCNLADLLNDHKVSCCLCFLSNPLFEVRNNIFCCIAQ